VNSINSLGSQSHLAQSLHSRLLEEPPAESVDSQRIRSTDKPTQEESTTTTLTSGSQSVDGANAPQTYSHLEKSLSSDDLDLADLRGSLGQLQGLVGDATSFKGTLRVVSEPGQFGVVPSVEGAADSGELFSLLVTTADGDRIEIQIGKSQGTEGSLSGGDLYSFSETSVTFKVDGDLDSGEREALGKLTDRLAGLGDNYRRDGWLQLGGLEAFDHTELASFKLDVMGGGSDSFSLQYDVDSASGQRSLLSDLNGYQYDISVDIDGFKLDKNFAENSQYEQYRQIIRDTAYSYRQGEQAGGVSSSKAAGFFLAGMDALFQVKYTDEATADPLAAGEPEKKSEVDSALAGMTASNQQLLDNFSSGLPDFVASFDTPEFRPNEDQPSEVSTMSLNMAQTTTVTRSSDADHSYTTVNQRSEYQSRVSQHLGLGGDSVDHANLDSKSDGGQSYLYRTDLKSASIDRSLNFQDGNKLMSVDELRDQQHIQKDKLVVEGELESKIIKDLSSPIKNIDRHVNVANTESEKRQAQEYLSDYRTIEQLDDLIDGNKVELFI
jgi:hypothetical protein